MVSKVIISPMEVRGLGNIVAKTSTEDYEWYLSSITASDDKYIMVYFDQSIIVTVSAQYVKSGGELIVTATVTDENGDPIEDASVEMFKEVN